MIRCPVTGEELGSKKKGGVKLWMGDKCKRKILGGKKMPKAGKVLFGESDGAGWP